MGLNSTKRTTRLFQVLGRYDLKFSALQILLVNKESFSIVFDHQHRQFRGVQLALHVGNVNRLGRARITDRHRNENVEPIPNWLLRYTSPPMQLGEFLRQRKAEASTFGGFLHLAFHLLPFLEDSGLIIGSDSYTCIGDGKHHRIVVAVRTATLTSPRSVNFNALEIKFRSTCETFASSVKSSGMSIGSSNARVTEEF